MLNCHSEALVVACLQDGQKDKQSCNGEGPPAITNAFAATTTAVTTTTVLRQQALHNNKDASTTTSPAPIDARIAGSDGKAAKLLGPSASLAAVVTAAQAVITALEAPPVSRWVPAGHKAAATPFPDFLYAPLHHFSCPPAGSSPNAHEQMIPALKASQAPHELCSTPGSGGSQRIAPAHCPASTSTATPVTALMRREGRFNIPMAEQVVETQASQAQMARAHVTHALATQAPKAEAQQGSGGQATPDECRARCVSGSCTAEALLMGPEVQPMGAIDRAALLAHSTAALACSMAQGGVRPSMTSLAMSTTAQAAHQAANPTGKKVTRPFPLVRMVFLSVSSGGTLRRLVLDVYLAASHWRLPVYTSGHVVEHRVVKQASQSVTPQRRKDGLQMTSSDDENPEPSSA